MICGIVIFSVLHAPINVPLLARVSGQALDMNHELKIHGVANLFSSCFGFMQTYQCFGMSLAYYKCGGGSRLGSCMQGLMVMLALPWIASIIPLLPRMPAGLFLSHVGIEMIMESLIDTWSILTTIEYIMVSWSSKS